jgi:RHS repeat-associated protein
VPPSSPTADLRYVYDATDDRAIKAAYDAGGLARYALYPLDALELRGTTWDAGTTDYWRTQATQVPYVFASGVRLGRIAYAGEDYPSLTSGASHLLLELTDSLGSTSLVIDRDTSELVEASTYQAYGGVASDYRAERWSAFREDYRFTGKEEDVEVGLQYFGKRYYAPGLERWTSPDPLAIHALDSDLNVFAYVRGRSFRSIDPFGLEDSPSWSYLASAAISIFLSGSPSMLMQYYRSRLRDSVEHPERRVENMKKTIEEAANLDVPGSHNEPPMAGAHAGSCGPGCACSTRARAELAPPALLMGAGRGPDEKPSAAKQKAQDELQAGLPTINGSRAIIPKVTRKWWNPVTRILKFEPGSRAAEVAPEGVKYNELGEPDLRPYQQAEVKIEGFSSDRAANMRKANDAMRKELEDPKWVQPEGTTWHEERDGTMRLVDSALHGEIPHTGGVADKLGEAPR